MPYTITKTDGSILADLLDNSVDKISTDLTLVGKSTNNYGLEFNQNFVKLLENFASTTAPKYPIKGQIWYDTSEEKIRIFNGSIFKEPNRPQISSAEPTLSPGDIWIDSLRRQLYFNDGQGTRLAGPIYTAQQGVSGYEIINITDITGSIKTLIKLKIGDILLGIFSKDTFTPNYLTTNGRALQNEGITGVVKKGFTPAIPEFNFYVTALNAQNLIDASGNVINASNFVQTVGSSTVNGALTIINESPLILGSSNNLSFQIGPNLSVIKSTIQNSNFAINAKDSTGVSSDAIFVSAGNKRVGIYNSVPLATLDVNGDANFRNNIVTNKTSIDIVNTTATTLNLAGAATLISIGSGTGTTTINNDLNVVKNVNINGGSLNSTLLNFNLLNTAVKTINIGSATNTINIGSANTGIVKFNNDVDIQNRLSVSGETQTGNVLIKENTVRSTSGNLLLNANTSIEFEKDALARQDLILKNRLIFDVGGTSKIITTPAAGVYFEFLPEHTQNILFGGEAELISIGAVTGNTYINNDLNVVGEFYVGYADSTPAYMKSKSESVYVFNNKVRNIYLGGTADNLVIGSTEGQLRVRNPIAYFDGDITLKGRSLTGGQSQADIRSDIDTRSASVFNENVTSLAIGGSAVNIEVGNTFGQTLIKNNLEINGSITINGRGINSKGIFTVGQFTTEFDLFPTYVTDLKIGSIASQIRIGRIEDPANLQEGGMVTVQHNLTVNNNLIMPKLDPNANTIGGSGLVFKDNKNVITASDLVRTYGPSRALGVLGDIYLSGRIYGDSNTAVLWNAEIQEDFILDQGQIKSLTNIANLFIDDGTGVGVQVDTINLGNKNTIVNVPGNLTLAWRVIRDNYEAKAGDRLLIDTARFNNNIQITLPLTPNVGDEIRFIDQTGVSGAAQLFVRRNGNLINATTNDINITTPGRAFNLVYTGATRGWVYDNA
jgi:hypothetical protein